MENKHDFYSALDNRAIEEIKRLKGPVLVVGGSGFIGANLFFILTKFRDDVFACSRNPQRSWRLMGVDPLFLISADIRNYEHLRMVVHKLKPRTVFNVSAYGAYARQTDSFLIHATNYSGTLNLIKALSDEGCDAFVHAGTSSEYGLNCEQPDEKDELLPNSDYAASKVGTSYLLKYYGHILKFPCVNMRLYSIYGPWEERDRLVPTLVSQGLKGTYPYFVNNQISRDFVYIDDCVSALVKAALKACRTAPGISVNIASGIKTTLIDVAKTAQEVFGIPSEPVFGSMQNRTWDLPDWFGNATLAKDLLDWRYSVPFKQGLQLSAAWEREMAGNLRYVFIPGKKEKISVIIACYKDSQSIPVLYERLLKVFRGAEIDFELIFVNDASPAEDEAVIAGLSMNDTHVVGITHSRNFGSQSAFISGMEIMTGDAAVLMDGDGQDPPELIPEFIDKWNQGHTIVFGERVKRDAPFHMQIFYKLFYRIFRKLSDIAMPVDAGDFSLIDKKAVGFLLKFPEKDIFIRGLRAWIGFNQTGVCYTRPERLFGKSTNNLLKNLWWAKKGIFSFSLKPLQFIQGIGIIFFLITIALGIFYFLSYIMNPPRDAKGITTVVMLVLGLGSIQLLSLSVIGDYIGKIIEEVKNRPKFIRSKIIYRGKLYDKEESMETILEELKTYHKHY
ncbi:MAG: NAD-dependent epimerase/dehydratase family protein [Chitinivibrionales bacterium]